MSDFTKKSITRVQFFSVFLTLIILTLMSSAVEAQDDEWKSSLVVPGSQTLVNADANFPECLTVERYFQEDWYRCEDVNLSSKMSWDSAWTKVHKDFDFTISKPGRLYVVFTTKVAEDIFYYGDPTVSMSYQENDGGWQAVWLGQAVRSVAYHGNNIRDTSPYTGQSGPPPIRYKINADGTITIDSGVVHCEPGRYRLAIVSATRFNNNTAERTYVPSEATAKVMFIPDDANVLPAPIETCCSSLNLSTLALEVPCIRIGEDTFSLSLSYSGGTLFKLENYALLDNSPCSTACCGNFDVETWLVSLPCVLVGETSLWTTFSLVANSEGLFFDLLGYGLNASSPVAEIKEITLDTSQDSSSFFSFVNDAYADAQTFDVFAEPWCTTPPRLCGHFVSLENRTLENVSAADVPAASAFPAEIECQDLAVGNTCIFKDANDSYTAATIASHTMPDSCTHRITLRYKSLSNSSTTSSCTVTEPQPQCERGDILWTHDVGPVNNHTMYVDDLPLAVGKDGSIYYSASGGQDNWEPSRIYALNKTDGSLK